MLNLNNENLCSRCTPPPAPVADISADGQTISRRSILKAMTGGFGWLAFSAMLGSMPGRLMGQPGPNGNGEATAPTIKARAKRVIFLCMQGAPSHVDTFDYKPGLIQSAGKSFSREGRVGVGSAKLLAPKWAFKPRGKSGLPISDLFPELSKHADKLCLLNSMSTDLPDHGRAFVKLHTGNSQFVRPSMGAWMIYGLGTENQNLPGYITINPPNAAGGAQNYGSAFLPAKFQGMPISGGRGNREAQVRYIKNNRLTKDNQRVQLDFIQDLNRGQIQRAGADPQIEGVIQSFEMAFKMQTAVPDVVNLENESQAVKDRYGIGQDGTDAFGKQCLLARRLSEAGVRFVEIQQGGWDHHRNLTEDLGDSARGIDKPIAALLSDLEERGLLDETLVLWGGEFGRTPYSQGSDGRDHNVKGYTMWMAGAGIKGGMRYGSTDEVGYEAVDKKVDCHDLHATILHLLGINHEELTYRYAGRDFRLTDVFGNVLKDVLA